MTNHGTVENLTDEEWTEHQLNELDEKVTTYEKRAMGCDRHRIISNAIDITNAKIAVLTRLEQKHVGRFLKIQERFDNAVNKFEMSCYCKRG